MGLFARIDAGGGDGDERRLAADQVVGRAADAGWHVAHPAVSSRHAAVAWRDGAWHVRDLGSRNGTAVQGEALEPGRWVPLAEGAVVAFGSATCAWRLVDARGPRQPPWAARLDGEADVAPVGGMLFLPDGDVPLASVYRDELGRWRLETGDTTTMVTHGAVVTVGGIAFQLWLGGSETATAEAAGPIGGVMLRFQVSADEEHVRIEAVVGGRIVDLRSRAHHYLLLTLARLRAKEEASGVDPAEAGWVYREDLERMLAVDRYKLNLDVHRARKQLAAAGIATAADVVQRRPDTQQLRLGPVRAVGI